MLGRVIIAVVFMIIVRKRCLWLFNLLCEYSVQQIIYIVSVKMKIALEHHHDNESPMNWNTHSLFRPEGE